MIRLQQLVVEFPGRGPGEPPITAVAGIDLEIPTGEVHCLIGTSGCGKTTTMKCVNRLVEHTAGTVEVDGEDVRSVDKVQLRRRIGYVVQEGGLFPHKTVAANIGLLCRLEGWPQDRTHARVQELMELVALPFDEFAHRHPWELSGGQQQRVGVARALALDPPHVLMDEPFGALDPITRSQLQDEFAGLLKRVAKTVMLVTHDLPEAFKLGDRISLMDAGRIVQTGPPEELLEHPASDFVAAFVREHSGGIER